MKDFSDLWFLSRKFPFKGELLKDAITRTFARREMPLPAAVPVALTPEFAALKTATWTDFNRRNDLSPVEMASTLDAIHAFAWPVMGAAANAMAFNKQWTPAKGWHQPKKVKGVPEASRCQPWRGPFPRKFIVSARCLRQTHDRGLVRT